MHSNKMKLTKNNIKGYLKKKKLIGPNTKITIKKLKGGWLNPIFLIQTPKKSFVVKQVLSKGKESSRYRAFYFPQERMINEYHALKLCNKYAPKHVPKLIYGDLKNYIMVMEYIENATLMYQHIKKKKISNKTIKALAKFITEVHNNTLKDKKIQRMMSNENYWDIKYKYQYLEVKCSKEVKEKLKEFVETFSKRKYCLVLGDFHTRNILIKKDKTIKAVDFEESNYLDPCHDIGIMLSDLIIFNHTNKNITKKQIKYFFNECIKRSRFKNKEDLKRSVIIHTSSSILSRLCGFIKHRFVPAKIKPELKRLSEEAILKEIREIKHFL